MTCLIPLCPIRRKVALLVQGLHLTCAVEGREGFAETVAVLHEGMHHIIEGR